MTTPDSTRFLSSMGQLFMVVRIYAVFREIGLLAGGGVFETAVGQCFGRRRMVDEIRVEDQAEDEDDRKQTGNFQGERSRRQPVAGVWLRRRGVNPAGADRTIHFFPL